MMKLQNSYVDWNIMQQITTGLWEEIVTTWDIVPDAKCK